MDEHGPHRNCAWERWIGSAILTVLACAGLSATGFAQTEEARVRITIIIPPLQRLEIDPAVVISQTPDFEDFEAGFIEINRPVAVSVASNVPWKLELHRVGTTSVPRDTLLLLWTGSRGAFAPLRDEWASVVSGYAGEHQQLRDLRFRFPLCWAAMPPGSYQRRVEFRLAPE